MQNLTFSSLSFSVSLAHCRHCQMGKAVGWGEMSMSGIKMPAKVFCPTFGGISGKRGYPLNIFVRISSERKTDGEM